LAEGQRPIRGHATPFAVIHQFYSQSVISRNQPYHAKLVRARFGTVSCV